MGGERYLSDAVGDAHTSTAAFLAGHAEAGAAEHHIEVHTVDTDGRVVLQTQVNVLLNAEAEVAGGREVALFQLVLVHLFRSGQGRGQKAGDK